MKMRALVLAGIISVAASGILAADEAREQHVTIGPKVWLTDNGLAEAPLWGAIVSADLTPNIWLSAMYLMGEYDDALATEKNTDGELLIGYSFDYLDVGFGFRHLGFSTELDSGVRWWTEAEIGYDEGKQRNADIYGPMVYVGSSHTFGEGPVGVYGGVSWMFKDFGDNSDMDFDGSHFNLEGGLTVQWKRLIATLGYRYKKFSDLPPRDVDGVAYNRDKVDGFAGSVRIIF